MYIFYEDNNNQGENQQVCNNVSHISLFLCHKLEYICLKIVYHILNIANYEKY